MAKKFNIRGMINNFVDNACQFFNKLPTELMFANKIVHIKY